MERHSSVCRINTHLEQGLKWSGDRSQPALCGRSELHYTEHKGVQILCKLGRESEAKTAMQTAMKLPATKPTEIHQYARQLLNLKKVDEAVAVFEYNAARFNGQWPTHIGLARGYSAKGDNRKALEEARLALPQAPDPLNKKSIQDMIKSLEAGQSIK